MGNACKKNRVHKKEKSQYWKNAQKDFLRKTQFVVFLHRFNELLFLF